MPSSVIRSFRYDPTDESLSIRFVSGRCYRYSRVPPAVYAAMRQSLSKGEYFNEHIRDRFSFTRED
jgi:lysyl-tRNA synthetase class 2